MRHPDLVQLFAERRRPSGRPLTTAAVEAMDLIEDALAWRMDAEVEAAKAEAEAVAKLKKAGGS